VAKSRRLANDEKRHGDNRPTKHCTVFIPENVPGWIICIFRTNCF